MNTTDICVLYKECLKDNLIFLLLYKKHNYILYCINKDNEYNCSYCIDTFSKQWKYLNVENISDADSILQAFCLQVP